MKQEEIEQLKEKLNNLKAKAQEHPAITAGAVAGLIGFAIGYLVGKKGD